MVPAAGEKKAAAGDIHGGPHIVVHPRLANADGYFHPHPAMLPLVLVRGGGAAPAGRDSPALRLAAGSSLAVTLTKS